MGISPIYKTRLKCIAAFLVALMLLLAAVIAIEVFGGQPMGLFSGSRPTQLGYHDGKFAPPPWKPNCVSSTTETSDKHYIAPLQFSGSPQDAWKRLGELIRKFPRTHVVSETAHYLYVEFSSAGMGFVDDVEFALDEKNGVIQVRSASRLGIRDFNVNRERVEKIRREMSN